MKLLSLFFVLLLSACATKESVEPAAVVPATPSELLETAYQHVNASMPERALTTLFEAQQQCMDRYDKSETKIFIHRTSDERFFYLLQATFEELATSVETGPCADISYLLGYAFFELGDLNNAQRYVTQASDYSPVNAAYLSELAHIYQVQGEFQEALRLYALAENNVQNFSPDNLKQEELTRAKRGVGYCLIELGQLDAAKAKFNEVLELNPQDQKALDELQFITQLQQH